MSTVQLYIRLKKPAEVGTYGINILILNVDPGMCLEEAVVLYHALQPAYMSAIVCGEEHIHIYQWNTPIQREASPRECNHCDVSKTGEHHVLCPTKPIQSRHHGS